MEEVFKETRKLVDEAKESILTSQERYNELINQRDNSKSNTLKQLLDEELFAYTSLTETMTKYLQLHFEKISKKENENSSFLRNSLREIKSIKNKERALEMTKILQNTYTAVQTSNDIDVVIANISIQNYMNVIDRNFKKWYEFVKILGNKVVDTVLDSIPALSEIKNLCENVKDIAELVNEFEKKSIDYSDVDKKLFEIEQHTLLMNLSQKLTEESIKILESNGESE